MTDPPVYDDGDRVSWAAEPADAPITGHLLRECAASLTVIKGHAQLIRRRVHALDGDHAEALERSLAAIEHAVQRIVNAMSRVASDGGDTPSHDEDKR